MNNRTHNWTSELSIGNSKIDNDHQLLLKIVDDLVEYNEKKCNRAEFARILTSLTDYSLIHFKKEEKYMEKIAYPNRAVHKDFHLNYIYTVAMYNLDLSNNNPPNPADIISFLEKWWKNHILKYDLDYENYKNENHINMGY